MRALSSHPLAVQLRGYRKQHGLTQRQTAALLGVYVQRISEIERGVRGVTPDIRRRILNLLARDRVTVPARST